MNITGEYKKAYLYAAGKQFLNKANIHRLPEELLDAILFSLNEVGRQNAALVNKKWLRLSQHAAVQPKKRDLQQFIKAYKKSLQKGKSENEQDQLEQVILQLKTLNQKVKIYSVGRKLPLAIKDDYYDIQMQLIEALQNLSDEKIKGLKEVKIPPALDHILLCAIAVKDSLACDQRVSKKFHPFQTILNQTENADFVMRFCMKKYSDLGAYPGVVFRDILIPYSLKNGDIAEALNMATRAPNNEMLYAIYDIISKQCIAIGDVVGAYVCCEEIARRYHYGTGLIARIVMDLAASKQPQLVKQITDNFLLHVPKRKRNENWSKKRFLMGISREFARQDNFDMANHFASKLTLIDRRKIKKELAGLEEQN